MDGAAFVLEYAHFAVPPDYQNGSPPGAGGDLVLLAYQTSEGAVLRAQGSAVLCPTNPRGSTQIVGGVVVDGDQGYLEVCTNQGWSDGDSYLSGHVFLHWWRRGVTYELGIRGDTRTNRAILIALVPFITYVSPA
jgi:hypothetical protein